MNQCMDAKMREELIKRFEEEHRLDDCGNIIETEIAESSLLSEKFTNWLIQENIKLAEDYLTAETQKIIAQEKFARKPTVGQKAWGLIHKFYSVILDNMERESINKSELAKRLGISRSAVTQMFNKTPNVSVRKMVEIADAVGVELDLIDSISESSNHNEQEVCKSNEQEGEV